MGYSKIAVGMAFAISLVPALPLNGAEHRDVGLTQSGVRIEAVVVGGASSSSATVLLVGGLAGNDDHRGRVGELRADAIEAAEVGVRRRRASGECQDSERQATTNARRYGHEEEPKDHHEDGSDNIGKERRLRARHRLEGKEGPHHDNQQHRPANGHGYRQIIFGSQV